MEELRGFPGCDLGKKTQPKTQQNREPEPAHTAGCEPIAMGFAPELRERLPVTPSSHWGACWEQGMVVEEQRL